MLAKTVNLWKSQNFKPAQTFATGGKRTKSKRSKIEFKEWSYNYTLYKQIKKMDYMSADNVYPMNLPLRFKYQYTGSTHIPHEVKYRKLDDIIRFDICTGNQILVNMKNFEHFRSIEKANSFHFLTKTPGACEHGDWENHEIVQKAIENVITSFEWFKTLEFALIVNAFEALGIRNEEFWKKVASDRGFKKHHPKLMGDHFAFVFLPLMKTEYITEETKDEMLDLMPRELENMSLDLVTQCFDATVQAGAQNDHNWHYHFYIYFRNKNYEFGPRNYVTIIKDQVKIEFYDEPDWWNNHFLPGIDMFMHQVVEEDACLDLISALELITHNDVETKGYIDKQKARIGYITTKYKLLESAKFHNMVQTDIAYYMEKEKLKLQQANAE